MSCSAGNGRYRRTLQQPDLLARRDQRLDRLLGGAGARAHQHDDPLGVGRTDVVDQAVPPAGPRRELVHDVLHDAGHGDVEGVGRLAGLEEDVGVLGRAAHDRRVGRHAPRPEGEHVVVADQRAQVVVVEQRDLVDLVRRAEPVEEVQERHPRAQAWRRGRRAAKSCASCTELEASIAQPVVRACITSLWSPKIDRAWVATARAATWITAGVSSPAILNMFGIISSRPCDEVNVVASAPCCSAPWSAPAAPASDCISMTSGTTPTGSAGPPPPSRRRARPSATPA